MYYSTESALQKTDDLYCKSAQKIQIDVHLRLVNLLQD